MELKKKVLLFLICIITFNYNCCAFAIDGTIEDSWNSGIAFASSTVESEVYDYIEDSGGIYLTAYKLDEEIVNIPDKINGKKVLGIYDETFAATTKTKKIIVPETVNLIFDNAFVFCRTLEEIEVAEENKTYASIDGVLYSKDYQYLVRVPEGRKGHIEVHDGTKYICDYSFFNCEKVTSIHIPASVIGTDENGDYGVGIGAFYGTFSLEEITVDSDSKYYEVYDGVLYKLRDNTNIKQILMKCPDKRANCVNIPSTVTQITHFAFYECNDLPGPINLPSKLSFIGEDAFRNCKNLDGEIVIPNTVISLGKAAFYGCEKIERITIGNGITEIFNDTFAYCKSLKEITIPDSVKAIGDRAFFYCTGAESLTLGSRVETIGNWAFDYLRSLKGDLIIPDSVKTIGTAAFMNSGSLDGYIEIGSKVQEIGPSAFYYSRLSKGVVFKGEIPSMTESSFLKPDVPYYYLEDKVGYTNSVLSQKDLRVYNARPTVNFMVMDEIYATVHFEKYGSKVNILTPPSKENYTFKGWFYDNNYTKPYSFDDEIMNNTTIYAFMEVLNELDITLSEETVELGQTYDIEYTYNLEPGATPEDIEWVSSDPEVATVENGVVTTLAKGEVEITATYKNATDKIKIIVWKDEDKLEITEDTVTIEKGEEYELEYNYHFVNNDGSDCIVWESSNPEIATIENGKIIALESGEITITASYLEVSDTVEVTILKNNALDIVTEDTAIKNKRSIDLEYTYEFNDGATDEDIIWETSNSNVAKVENGKVTAVLEGQATITATYKNVTDSIKITVVEQDKFDFAKEAIKVEDWVTTKELDYTFSSYDKTEDDITWHSSHPEVATVENGVITILSCGQTSITAIFGDTADSIIVNVVKPNLIHFNEDGKVIRFEKDAEVEYDYDYYFNDGATNSNITFVSDNEEVIKVENNKLIQVGIGVANITASYDNVSDTLRIEIIPQDYIKFGSFGSVVGINEEFELPYEKFIYNQQEEITFTSSNEDVVKIDETGKVTLLNEGEAIITASYQDITAQLVIVVKDKNYRKGDLNLDNLVDSADAAIALNIYKYNNATNTDLILGDMDENGMIDSADAAIILNVYKYNL